MGRRGTRSRARSNKMRHRGLLTELLGYPARESTWRRVVGWALRARVELTVVSVVITGHVLLVASVGMSNNAALITETTLIIILVCLPGTRARIWAATSRHRIWKCMHQTRTMTPDGIMPYLVWSSPIPVGERIRVWLPAGLSVNDLDQITEALAAACYATEARVETNRRFSHLVTITMVRRDPFTGKRLLRPHYATDMPVQGSDGAFAPLPNRATLPVPVAPAQHPTVAAFANKSRTERAERSSGAQRGTTGRGGTAETTNPEPSTPPPVVGVGGTDVSDYV